jgi:hypothetical protein
MGITSNPQMVFNLDELIVPTPLEDLTLPFSSEEIDAVIPCLLLIKPLTLMTLMGFFQDLLVTNQA